MAISFFAIAHAATSWREMRSWSPIWLIDGSDPTPGALQPGQLHKDVFKARTKGCNTYHPRVVRLRVGHHAVDDFCRILGKELVLVAFLACRIHHWDLTELVKARRGGAV